MIVVRLPTVLRPFAGGAEQVEVAPVATAREVVAALEPPLRRRLTDEQGAIRRHVNIYLGDDNLRDLAGLDTPVPPDATLLILPSVAGG
ncbi:molybdopterin synthase sulfur carrier subunit [Kribbella sandramycini]|uniref:Molybdopterin converting factor small subunit n=1 Tax=Kribbella sandramycini TaxID=60450 RepID=A0A7Y4L619_9ACTN|nr:MoaD/ThiS family protein [Kribbella sandramycini]MBB6570702.1 molybdopterin converting factor small subunit [Kribbella sandramycini]NOL43846.1 molybdopterin synthase sulfur carrier subunit [Kribbella sandramycini]